MNDRNWLEQEFRKLEREVRQRECGHRESVRITHIADVPVTGRYMCSNCGVEWGTQDNP